MQSTGSLKSPRFAVKFAAVEQLLRFISRHNGVLFPALDSCPDPIRSSLEMLRLAGLAVCRRVKVILVVGALVMSASSAAFASDDAVLVWTNPESGPAGGPADGSANLSFARKKGGKWLKPEKITDSSFPDIQPAIVADKSGNAWVVWVELRNRRKLHGQLRYRFQREGIWLPAEDLPSDLSTNLAPSIMLDGADTPWIVWAGVDGHDDEIFFSRWDGSGWSKPMRVNEDNDVPDVLPELELGVNGQPVVSWLGFNGNIYVRRVRTWDGSGWKDVPVSQEKELSMRDFKPVELPDYVTGRYQASVYVLGSRRSVKLQKR